MNDDPRSDPPGPGGGPQPSRPGPDPAPAPREHPLRPDAPHEPDPAHPFRDEEPGGLIDSDTESGD